MDTIVHYLAEDIKVNQDFKYRQIVGLQSYRSIVIGEFPRRSSEREYPYEYVYRGDIRNWGAFFKKHNVKAIHCHLGFDANKMLPIARRWNIPLIVSFRGNDASSLKRENKKAYRKLAKYGSLFLPVCKYFKKELIKLGFPKKRIKVLYGGIDTDKFYYRSAKPTKDGEFRILMVGRLAGKKGLPVLLRAFKIARSKLPKAKLVIVGKGKRKEKKELQRDIRAARLKDAVKLKGAMPNAKIVKEMHRADLFCLPSLTTRNGAIEGIPNVLKEAMACGVPVVSTFHAGIPELITHKKEGLLVKERDARALANAIVRLYRNPDRATAYAVRARRKVAKSFHLPTQIKVQEQYYDKLLRKRS